MFLFALSSRGEGGSCPGFRCSAGGIAVDGGPVRRGGDAIVISGIPSGTLVEKFSCVTQGCRGDKSIDFWDFQWTRLLCGRNGPRCVYGNCQALPTMPGKTMKYLTFQMSLYPTAAIKINFLWCFVGIGGTPDCTIMICTPAFFRRGNQPIYKATILNILEKSTIFFDYR